MATAFPGHTKSGSQSGLPDQDSDQEAGLSGSRPSRHGKAQSRASKPSKMASKASEQEARQRHKAIERTIQKAQKEAEKKKRSLQCKEPAGSQLAASGQTKLLDIPEELPVIACLKMVT